MGQTVEDSMLVRALIVQNSWPWATSSGLFGYGNTIRHSQLNLDSVDNSYMLFTMRRGFAFLVLFLCVPILIAWRGVKAFRRAPHPMQRLPLAIAVSGCMGIMVAMYTVWFGFVYSVLWTILIGLTMSMMDVLIHGAPTVAAASNAALAARNRAMYRPSRPVVLGGA